MTTNLSELFEELWASRLQKRVQDSTSNFTSRPKAIEVATQEGFNFAMNNIIPALFFVKQPETLRIESAHGKFFAIAEFPSQEEAIEFVQDVRGSGAA